jgi:phosphotransferase system  glucose/maltose/N-acetylglucosamine-specific IIC component
MTNDRLWTWMTVYLVINVIFAVGFLLLARFIRKNAPLTDGREQERAGKQGITALVALGLSLILGGKFLWAMISGQNLEMSRHSSWKWVSKDTEPSMYWLSTVLDAGFAIICVVGCVCFLVVRFVELQADLDPVRRMQLKLRWIFLLFWIFVLVMESCVFLGYGVLGH